MSTTTVPESPKLQPSQHAHRLRHVLVGVGIAGLALLLAFFAGGGWYFSSQIHSDLLDATDEPISYELSASPLGSTELRIDSSAATPLPDVLTTDAVYAVRAADGGRVVLAGVTATGADSVVRSIAPEDGKQYWSLDPGTLEPGQTEITSTTDVDYYREIWEEPSDLGMPSTEVVVDGPGGPLPAWLVPGHGTPETTWAVMVHGKGGTRAEPLRSLITVSRYGLYALLVTYRNDTGVYPSADGQYGYGTTEWRDLEASVQYALDQGATDVVLFGYSLGGAITAAFLENSPLAEHVSAVVLDSPMLDVARTVRFGAAQRTVPVVGTSIPGPLVWSALQISRLRFGSDWYRADYLDDTSWLTVPTLVFQGTDDDTVPPSTAAALATAQPELVTTVVTDDAGHVESWNADPAAYGESLRSFLVAAIGCWRNPDDGTWCR